MGIRCDEVLVEVFLGCDSHQDFNELVALQVIVWAELQ